MLRCGTAEALPQPTRRVESASARSHSIRIDGLSRSAVREALEMIEQ